MEPGPVLVEEHRNGRVQAVHCGHAVLLAPDGGIQAAWGDPGTATYWRSSAKPLQAIAFARVLDAYGLGDEELALACGSHMAEALHIQAARRILAAAGLDETLLRCGRHDVDERWAGPRPPGGWTEIHNNCSGKHAAMLAVCARRGWSLEDYLDPTHPLQQEILGLVARATGLGKGQVPFGVDGCGLPTYFLPISALARAYRWLVVGGDPVAARTLAAVADHPLLVAGRDRLDTDLPRATAGRVVSKIGALGVHAAVDLATGAAYAAKLADGSSPARDALTVEALTAGGWLRPEEADRLARHARPAVTDNQGTPLGAFVARLPQP